MTWLIVVWLVGVPISWVMLRFVLAVVSMGNKPSGKEKAIAWVLAVFWPLALVLFLSYAVWGWMSGVIYEQT